MNGEQQIVDSPTDVPTPSAEDIIEAQRQFKGKIEGILFSLTRSIGKFIGLIVKILVTIIKDVVSGLLQVFSRR